MPFPVVIGFIPDANGDATINLSQQLDKVASLTLRSYYITTENSAGSGFMNGANAHLYLRTPWLPRGVTNDAQAGTGLPVYLGSGETYAFEQDLNIRIPISQGLLTPTFDVKVVNRANGAILLTNNPYIQLNFEAEVDEFC